VITIDAADVVPMTQFALAWRFTDERWSRRGGEALRDVRPLTPARAAGLHGPLAAACQVAREGGARHVPAACQDEAGARQVGSALTALGPGDHERIVIAWDHATALETSWLTFREHWEVFCYPGSDDVTISSRDEGWVLCYHHWEEFSFSPATAASESAGFPPLRE
jgi:hypothetical protein